LLTTAAMRASHRSSAQARTIASMLEPRPEMRMTMFFIGARSVSAADYPCHPEPHRAASQLSMQGIS
jgi:hypothetical protein